MATSVSKTSVSKSRTRAICWTLFNYEPYIDNIKQYAEQNCEYAVFGKEICPTTQKPHLQGYFYYKNPIQYPNKKWRKLVDGHAHDEVARGTPKQNYEYCSKAGDTWTTGTMPTQGARVDWEEARSQLEITTVANVIRAQPHLLPNIRALERYQQIALEPLNRDVKTYVLIGESGIGKSRWAYDNYPNLYSKPDGKWFDGYNGETTILLDDFYGDIPYSTLLKVLDRYPLNVPVKCGFVYAQWTTVIITSNKPPDSWYIEGLTSALERRITCIDTKHTPNATTTNETQSD